LRTATDAGQASAVEHFWDEINTKGAPLIEPLDGDDKNMLVTFLWKGTIGTKNVMVLCGFLSLFSGRTTIGRPDSVRQTSGLEPFE
jgi:hypothetical protein